MVEIRYTGDIADQPEVVHKAVRSTLYTNGLPSTSELQDYFHEILKIPVGILERNADGRSWHPLGAPWTIEWSDRMTRYGAYINCTKRHIQLSIRQFLQYGIAETKGALRHEAAHALEYWVHGSTAGHTRRFHYYRELMGGDAYASCLSRDVKQARIVG